MVKTGRPRATRRAAVSLIAALATLSLAGAAAQAASIAPAQLPVELEAAAVLQSAGSSTLIPSTSPEIPPQVAAQLDARAAAGAGGAHTSAIDYGPIYNFSTRMAVTVSGWPPSTSDGGRLWMGPYGSPWSHQEWKVLRWAPPTPVLIYSFQARNSGKCMDIQGPSKSNGAIVHQWGCYSANNQIWVLDYYGYDSATHLAVFEFRNLYSNRCLDITGMNPNPKAYLQQWDCNHTWNQRFMVSGIYGR
jgi:Ricin-type beta-trefoil lectin domain-like